MSRIVFSVFGLALLLTSRAFPADQAYEINAILPLTGPAAFLGTHEAQAMALLEASINRSGGIRGRPIKFVIQDDASVAQTSVQLTSALIARKVPVIIGSATASPCLAMEGLIEKSGPVTYCTAPTIEPATGSYEFSGSIGGEQFVPLAVRFLKGRGWNKVALITSTDASGQDFERHFDDALAAPEGKSVQVVDREHYNIADLSMAAQVARIKAAAPQVIVTFSVGPSFGTLLRQFNDSGLVLPVLGSAANMSYSQLGQYTAFVPKELYFIAAGGAVSDPNAPPKVRQAQDAFQAAFRAGGIRPEYLYTLGWDPAYVVVEALRHLGTDATAAQLHDYLGSLHDFGGIAGMYDFRLNPQRGLDGRSTVIYKWNSDKQEITTVAH